MIKTFQHKGLQALFERGTQAGITPSHVARLKRILSRLNEASNPQAMNVPGWGLHRLKGNQAARWAVTVNGNWRLTFEFEGSDAILVDYLDYH
ncbi:type II toxin-antitoxin system RelE/ParE family toxin [Variovorax sp. GT1P44]|uniref:type II toxin-antitoxin system RelE/ParE family toxin n=1 Tax=Variovorax sp. GT1P44 TaxID=3443742 RepID=UPI003F468489